MMAVPAYIQAIADGQARAYERLYGGPDVDLFCAHCDSTGTIRELHWDGVRFCPCPWCEVERESIRRRMMGETT